MCATRLFRISAANIGPNRFHQNRTVSWLLSIPRSAKRSSTLRSDSGYFTYISTARRIISGSATSLLAAGARYGIPVTGTMAHSFVQAFDSTVKADKHRQFSASTPAERRQFESKNGGAPVRPG